MLIENDTSDNKKIIQISEVASVQIHANMLAYLIYVSWLRTYKFSYQICIYKIQGLHVEMKTTA